MSEYLEKHRKYCCVLHGCAFDDETCPVVTQEVNQLCLCNECQQGSTQNMIDCKNKINAIHLKKITQKLHDVNLEQPVSEFSFPRGYGVHVSIGGICKHLLAGCNFNIKDVIYDIMQHFNIEPEALVEFKKNNKMCSCCGMRLDLCECDDRGLKPLE